MSLHPLAGKAAPASSLVNIPKLLTAYYTEKPDPAVPEQRVSFGTSGHRGSSLHGSFNESHIIAICQAIALFRKERGTTGPLFLGMDTHALSYPAFATAMEVLAANGVEVILAEGDEYTPTPVISHAILTYNKGRKEAFADGIIITPSHNPPQDCGLKYNETHGGPAEKATTDWIQKKANQLLEVGVCSISRIPFDRAIKASTTHRKNFMAAYVDDLENVIDMEVLRGSLLPFAVDPLGGAGVHYWKPIAEKYKLNLTIVNESVDPTFAFMTLDWDGQIRMDPSSPYAMQRLIQLKDRYTLAFACDTDHDRHGIVTKSAALLPSNHFLSVSIDYLFRNRPLWSAKPGVGKTIVSSDMINRVAQHMNRAVYEVPVGFKWFVDGLYRETLGICGEESAGATFLRLDGSVWTTEKDGMIMGLLAAEMTAKLGADPGELYKQLTEKFGNPYYTRVDAPATAEEKSKISQMTPESVSMENLAGEKIVQIITTAAGNHQPIGGIKVVAENGWFAIRPSGTEDIYKIYAESFISQTHLDTILQEAKRLAKHTK
jgi:phosphoglucomutase